MNLPIISWHILEDTDYIQDTEYYLGSFNPQSIIKLNVQIWNNRYGQTEVMTLDNARLCIYFETMEDGALLNYCSIGVNNDSPITPTVELNRATLEIGRLSGESNNGISNDKNRTNYKNVSIEFKGLPSNLRNGLKNMFLDIEIN